MAGEGEGAEQIEAESAGGGEAIGGAEVTLSAPLTMGHKLAARAIAEGETVLKYNFPIGVATEDIAPGAHVHVHNMRSDYTPTYVIPEDGHGE